MTTAFEALSNGPDDPWTCSDCGWTEGDPPREHGEEPAT